MAVDIKTHIRDLEVMSKNARIDFENIPDDCSVFPNLTSMKTLKLIFMDVSNSTGALAIKLSDIQKTGQII